MNFNDLNTAPEGVMILAHCFICFSEISAIFYEPKDKTLKLTFTFNRDMDESEFQELARFIDESIHTYHMMNGIEFVPVDFSMESQGAHTFFHIIRDFVTLSKGELSLITTILRDKMGNDLAMGSEPVAEEIQEMYDENLDRLLMRAHSIKFNTPLVGMRDGDSFTVYDR